MRVLEHVPPDLDPPAEGLTADELARAERWKRVLTVSCTFEIDCWKDAEALTNQLEFVRWRRVRGEGRR